MEPMVVEQVRALMSELEAALRVSEPAQQVGLLEALRDCVAEAEQGWESAQVAPSLQPEVALKVGEWEQTLKVVLGAQDLTQ